MLKKLVAGTIAGIAGVALVAAPALATPTDPGVLLTINASGGQTTSDGLKLDFAYGQAQITREGSPQFYPGCDSDPCANDINYPGIGLVASPNDPLDATVMSNYFVVALKNPSNGNVYLYGDGNDYSAFSPASLFSSNDWEGFTSESTLTDDGKSGTVINHLSAEGGNVLLDVTFSYTYPNSYYNVSAALTLTGAQASYGHKIYWYTDSLLGGSDDGDQFGGTTPEGQNIAGVTNAAGDRIEAYRAVTGQSLNWFAGYYQCPYDTYDESDCGAATNDYGFVANYADFPNVFAPNTAIDNGFGISSAESTSATETISFDLLFTSCLEGVTPYECADAALNPKLPNTGVDGGSIAGFATAAVALSAVGFALVVMRRRARA